MNLNRLITAVLLGLLASALVFAQQQARQGEAGLITFDNLLTYLPKSVGPVQWEEDGRGYLTLEPSPVVKGGIDIVRYEAMTGARTLFTSAEKFKPKGTSSLLTVDEFYLSPGGQKLLLFTNSQRVWRGKTRGDYWVLDLKDWGLRKLGGEAKPSTLMFAKFSPDGARVGYVRENDIYVEGLPDGRITRVTQGGSPRLINGAFDWVYEEELFCRDGWRWSPDGKQIAYWQLDTGGVKDFMLVNNTAGLYPAITSFPYPKAGEMNSAARVGVVGTSGGMTKWLDVPGDPRNHYLARMEWAAGSQEVIIQQLNRLQNTNLVMLGEVRSGRVRPILTERDEAWVDVSWGDIDWNKRGLARGDVEWIDSGKRFLWASERDGWRHIYSVSRDGGNARCLTPGNFDVISVEQVDTAGGWLYFAASPDNATQRHLFRTRLDGGGQAERLSPADQPGTHRYRISPRGDLAIHTYSTFSRGPVTDLVRLPQHASVRTLVDNEELLARLGKLKPWRSEFFRVDIGGGVELDGWVIKPPDFDPRKRYPVLFYVYGEPWAQTVLDSWGGMMWHFMLAQQGYLVMSVDNRGTPAPRGRAWRKAIYRRMGILNSQDQADAVRAIVKWPFVDPKRIGIWGASGGGSSSLNAIFRHPDLYRLAIALAPVADIRYYDTIYQERYCGLPQDHPDEYKQSSPVTFAGQLRGHLLIVHGTGDDNVHYQGTETLIDALVAAGKPFTIMPYPNRSHSLSEGTGTTRHLFELLTRFLNEKLPLGPASND